MPRKILITFALLLSLLIPSVTAQAVVTRVEITERVAYAGGMSFGTVGPYEQIRGRLYYEVDPATPANTPIEIGRASCRERVYVLV